MNEKFGQGFDDFGLEVADDGMADDMRQRLLAVSGSEEKSDSSAYEVMPCSMPDEFEADDNLLSWDADGWELFR